MKQRNRMQVVFSQSAIALLAVALPAMAATPASAAAPKSFSITTQPAAATCAGGGQIGVSDVGIYPPCSKPFGLTYAEWAERWWQWLLPVPKAVNPNFDTRGDDCAQGQSAPVWFLGGGFGGTFVRTCRIPTNTALFFPVLNIVGGDGAGDCKGSGPADPGLPPCDSSFMANLANVMSEIISGLALPELTIDGILFRNIPAYRVASPAFSYWLTDENIFTTVIGTPHPAGLYNPVMTDLTGTG